MTARAWTVDLGRPADWISANHRHHYRHEAELVRLWRDAAHVHARAAKLPQLGRAHITATLHFGDRRRRDPHNYYPTLKAVVDGLIDHGLLPDDSSEYLTGPDIRMGDPGKARVVLTIREVT